MHIAPFTLRKRKSGFLATNPQKSTSPRTRTHIKTDSNSTTLINPKISDSFSSSILKLKLSTQRYNRAESELRQILNTSKPNNKSITLQRFKSVGKSFTFAQGKKDSKKYDSSLGLKEADMIINEYRNIKKPEIWGSLMKNFKANPQQLLELIPISLVRKGKISSPRPRNFKSPKSKVIISCINPPNSRKVSANTPDIVETLKTRQNIITEDWAKSLLYYNIKNHKGLSTFKTGFTENNLSTLLHNIPTSSQHLEKVFKQLLLTIKHLLIEMLGTSEDYLKFKEHYQTANTKTAKHLIVKCLDLYMLRESTIKILNEVITREKAIKELRNGDKDLVIKIHLMSKKLREDIQSWVKEKIVPFTAFIFKSQNYLEKMDCDLLILQQALSPKSTDENFRFN